MVKVYGCSDDLLEIEGSKYYENEIDCYERDVVLYFEDGTVIRAGYHKPGCAVWYIRVEKAGDSSFTIMECNDQDADIYSDIFETDSDIISHRVIKQGEPTPEFLHPGQLVAYVSSDGKMCEIGKIERLTADGAFVFYSSGETAALTSYDFILPIKNAAMIPCTLFNFGR